MLDGVGIVELRNILHGSGQLCPGAGIHLDGFFHQNHVEPDASVVDFLINVIFLPDEVRYREIGKALLDCHLNLDVPLVIGLEGFPLLRIMEGHVTSAASIGFCRSTGNGEVFDECLALVHLLVFELQHLTDAFKGKRQSHRGRPDHRAAPAFRIQEPGALRGERMIIVEGVKAYAKIGKIPG